MNDDKVAGAEQSLSQAGPGCLDLGWTQSNLSRNLKAQFSTVLSMVLCSYKAEVSAKLIYITQNL